MEDRAADRRRRLAAARVYLLATDAVSGPGIGRIVLEGLEGGVGVFQVREKTATDRLVRHVTELMCGLCEPYGTLVLVNDRIENARDAGADGVHLGQEDRSVAEARRILGPAALVGVSVHDETELERALRDGADYVGVGSVFPTKTKGRAVPVSGPDALAPLAVRAEAAGVPAFAIGGITPSNVAKVRAAGFLRVAACAGILRSRNPRWAARRLAR